MAIPHLQMDEYLEIESPRSLIAMQRCGITQDMLQYTPRIGFNARIMDPEMAEEAYRQQQALRKMLLDTLRKEYENVCKGITKQEAALFPMQKKLATSDEQLDARLM